jgi:hypothetical protein
LALRGLDFVDFGEIEEAWRFVDRGDWSMIDNSM